MITRVVVKHDNDDGSGDNNDISSGGDLILTLIPIVYVVQLAVFPVQQLSIKIVKRKKKTIPPTPIRRETNQTKNKNKNKNHGVPVFLLLLLGAIVLLLLSFGQLFVSPNLLRLFLLLALPTVVFLLFFFVFLVFLLRMIVALGQHR